MNRLADEFVLATMQPGAATAYAARLATVRPARYAPRLTGSGSPPRRRLPTSRRAGGPFDLTGGQDVLRLIAEGPTNRGIADELFVRTHTVSHHLRGVFAKTGTWNRTAAAAVATRGRNLL